MSDATRPASPVLVSAHKIAVAGLGLIGGSIARRLVEHHRFVTAWNHHPHPYDQARADGIRCVDTLQELVEGKPDILILAVPLESMGQVLAGIAPHLHRGTTLTDVGSVKGPVCKEVAKAGLGEFYVGAHPMAGNERSGFDASDPSLFDGALWALTFDETTDYSRFLTVADMVTKGLDNQMIAVDDETHDKAAALISHMPHVVSTALTNELVGGSFADPAVAVALSAGSWRDMSRVSLTDPDRTRAMVELDAANVATLLESVSARLQREAALLRSELEGQQKAFALSKDFFEEPQPFRDYKATEGQIARGESEPRIEPLRLSDASWRSQLLASAQAGERVVEFRTTHEARVEKRPHASLGE
jgi:prephenate dehydrogenase